MTNLAKLLLIIFFASLASNTLAHSGRTDAYGGHNCSDKSKEKGLCTGYHYHNNSNLNEPELVGAEVSPLSQNNDNVVKQHSHHYYETENLEG